MQGFDFRGGGEKGLRFMDSGYYLRHVVPELESEEMLLLRSETLLSRKHLNPKP